MTVGDYYLKENLDADFIEQHFEGPYWEKCQNFIDDNWTKSVELMSDKQKAWFKKILDDCIEKRIEG